MLSFFHSRIVHIATLAVALSLGVGASTATAGSPAHGQATRQLASVLTLDDMSSQLDILVTFAGTPPRPGSREEARLLARIRTRSAAWALGVIGGHWMDQMITNCTVPIVVDGDDITSGVIHCTPWRH
jgi:hypothetical protein